MYVIWRLVTEVLPGRVHDLIVRALFILFFVEQSTPSFGLSVEFGDRVSDLSLVIGVCVLRGCEVVFDVVEEAS